MPLFKTNKTVLSFKNNPHSFLNGITSNDMTAPRNAFLNIHGKIVATFDQISLSENELWICLESGFLPKVEEHIQRYVMLAKVEVNTLDRNVYFDLERDCQIDADDKIIEQKYGRLIISFQDKEASVSEREFTQFRLIHDIPLHGTDFHDDFILNVSTEEFVSFTKGCYLGQEPVSKVHSRSKPTWKLAVKKIEDCTDDERSRLTSIGKIDGNDEAGFVFVKNS